MKPPAATHLYTVWRLCGCSCMTLVSTGGGCGIFSWAQPRAVGGRSSSRDGGGGHQSSISTPAYKERGTGAGVGWGFWCTTKLGHQVGTRLQNACGSLMNAHTVHVLVFFQLGRAGLPAVNHQL